ncbi:MAG: J domain-containing protein [Cyanobacteria bacterium J06632_22]
MPAPEDDYYRRLRVPRNASREDIKAAFRRLARQYHPDLNPNNPQAQETFRALREAYEVLMDTVQRQHYDQGKTERMPEDVTPQTAPEFYMRGVQRAFSRHYRDALADFDAALTLDTRFLEAYLRRAQTRYVLGDDAGVLADCQRALQIESENGQAFYYQGLARYRLGYTQGAIAAFTLAIELDPDDPQLYYQRGISHEDLQERPEAVADYQTAAHYFQQQGDRTGVQQVKARLSKLGFTSPAGKPAQRLGPGLLQGVGNTLRSLVQILINPTGELFFIHARLSPRQALQTGCGLALVATACFTLGAHALRLGTPGWATAAGLWATASSVFLSLALTLAFSRRWFRRPGRWSSDVLMAGATVLPLGLYTLVGPLTAIIPPLALLVSLMTFSHTLLILYGGCTQIYDLPAQTAAWITPSLLFLSLCVGYAVQLFWV